MKSPNTILAALVGTQGQGVRIHHVWLRSVAIEVNVRSLQRKQQLVFASMAMVEVNVKTHSCALLTIVVSIPELLNGEQQPNMRV